MAEPNYLLNLASFAASFGRDLEAIEYMDAALAAVDKLSARQRRQLEPSILRRRAQILHDADAAKEAVLQAEGKYSKATGQILEAGIRAMEGQDRSARDAVRDYWSGVDRPLFYDALAYFIDAALELREAKPDIKRAHSALVRCQFVVCMLGLNPRLPYTRRNATALLPDMTAGHRLCEDARFHVARQQLFEWRREAIGESKDATSIWSRVNAALTRG